jgi:hypothetical protein
MKSIVAAASATHAPSTAQSPEAITKLANSMENITT